MKIIRFTADKGTSFERVVAVVPKNIQYVELHRGSETKGFHIVIVLENNVKLYTGGAEKDVMNAVFDRLVDFIAYDYNGVFDVDLVIEVKKQEMNH